MASIYIEKTERKKGGLVTMSYQNEVKKNIIHDFYKKLYKDNESNI